MKNLIFQAQEEYKKITQELERGLNSKEIDPKTLEKVNYLQRSLFDTADYAFKIPEFFTEELVSRVNSLLIRAGEYLRGTFYEERALERPQEFIGRVNSMKEARAHKRYSACAAA